MTFRNIVREPKHLITGVRYDHKRKIYQSYIVGSDGVQYQKAFKSFFDAYAWRKLMEKQFGYVELSDVEKEAIRKIRKAEKDRLYYEKKKAKAKGQQ